MCHLYHRKHILYYSSRSPVPPYLWVTSTVLCTLPLSCAVSHFKIQYVFSRTYQGWGSGGKTASTTIWDLLTASDTDSRSSWTATPLVFNSICVQVTNNSGYFVTKLLHLSFFAHSLVRSLLINNHTTKPEPSGDIYLSKCCFLQDFFVFYTSF